MLTQTERVYNALQSDMVHQYWGLQQNPPIARLAARINDLKRSGHEITTIRIDGYMYYILKLKSTPGEAAKPATNPKAQPGSVSPVEDSRPFARSGFDQTNLMGLDYAS